MNNKQDTIKRQAETANLPKYIKLGIIDLVAVTVAFFFALFFRFESSIPTIYLQNLYIYIILGFLLSSGFMIVVRAYAVDINSFHLLDAVKMGVSLIIGYVLFLLLNNLLIATLPFLVLINYFCLNTFLFGMGRLLLRAISWFQGRMLLNLRDETKVKNILIFGAGSAGTYLLNMLMYAPKEKCRVACFIDDNPELWGRKIKGIKVMGGRENIPKTAERYGVDEIIIAIPRVDNTTIREIFRYCTLSGCNIKRFADMSEFSGDSLAKATIKEVNLEDLLGRNEVKLDMKHVEGLIGGKVVLVTGGAGSIGSEICSQALKFGAKKVVIFDFNENGLFEIENKLKKKYSKSQFKCVLGSIRDILRLREVFTQYEPEIVFHAAAHKHVPMMEINPYEALTNNVRGTYNTAVVAKEFGVSRFILISTDKAVNPSNMMGASKRIAELVIRNLSHNSKTVFAAVRFGNVLGSNGSVIPLFKRQISEGGPITVTDRNIKRYFMTIPEAVQLVLESSAMAKDREVFVLNMGEPVYIYDLACTMIRLSGLQPEKDIQIQFTGLRDGEKMFEEISLDTEYFGSTKNDRIFILKSEMMDREFVDITLNELFDALIARKHDEIFTSVKTLVPSFSSDMVVAAKVPVDAGSIDKLAPVKSESKKKAPIHVLSGEQK